MRIRVVLATGVAASLVGGLAATAPAMAAPRPAVPEQAITRLQQIVQTRPDQYTGITVDEAAHVLHVAVPPSRLSSAAGDLTRFAAMPAVADLSGQKLTIVVGPSVYSLQQANATMDRVDTVEPWASTVHSSLTSWFVDPSSGRVRIGLTTVTPQMQRLATSTFGDRAELFRQDRFKSQDLRVPASEVAKVVRRGGSGTGNAALAAGNRLTDASPFRAGDRIWSFQTINGTSYIVQCTTGWVVGSGSTRQMATAGHCGPAGTSWDQGYYNPTTHVVYDDGPIGTTGHVEWGNNRLDGEVLTGGSYRSGSVWTGPNNGALKYGISGEKTSLAVGQEICSDGSVNGENCAAKIDAVNSCLNLNDDGKIVKVCNQAQAQATGTDRIVQPGDSGGPMYDLSSVNDYVLAAGLISGGNDTGSAMNFTQINYFDSKFGVVVVAGTP